MLEVDNEGFFTVLDHSVLTYAVEKALFNKLRDTRKGRDVTDAVE
jgi:hypothetical protein